MQPGIVETLEYEDISNRGTLSLVKGALEKNSDLKWFNDGLLSYNVNFNQEFLDKYVRETVITNDTTFEFSFEDYEGVRGLMIYNSKYKEKIFKKVKNIEFISEENGAEKVWYIKELNLDTKTNCFYNQFDLENGIETLEAVTYGGGGVQRDQRKENPLYRRGPRRTGKRRAFGNRRDGQKEVRRGKP